MNLRTDIAAGIEVYPISVILHIFYFLLQACRYGTIKGIDQFVLEESETVLFAVTGNTFGQVKGCYQFNSVLISRKSKLILNSTPNNNASVSIFVTSFKLHKVSEVTVIGRANITVTGNAYISQDSGIVSDGNGYASQTGYSVPGGLTYGGAIVLSRGTGGAHGGRGGWSIIILQT